jgi:hypothetical protein
MGMMYKIIDTDYTEDTREPVGVVITVWYDRSIRLWTAHLVASDGIQVGDAFYSTTRADAVAQAADSMEGGN